MNVDRPSEEEWLLHHIRYAKARQVEALLKEAVAEAETRLEEIGLKAKK